MEVLALVFSGLAIILVLITDAKRPRAASHHYVDDKVSNAVAPLIKRLDDLKSPPVPTPQHDMCGPEVSAIEMMGKMFEPHGATRYIIPDLEWADEGDALVAVLTVAQKDLLGVKEIRITDHRDGAILHWGAVSFPAESLQEGKILADQYIWEAVTPFLKQVST